MTCLVCHKHADFTKYGVCQMCIEEEVTGMAQETAYEGSN